MILGYVKAMWSTRSGTIEGVKIWSRRSCMVEGTKTWITTKKFESVILLEDQKPWYHTWSGRSSSRAASGDGRVDCGSDCHRALEGIKFRRNLTSRLWWILLKGSSWCKKARGRGIWKKNGWRASRRGDNFESENDLYPGIVGWDRGSTTSGRRFNIRAKPRCTSRALLALTF